MLFLNASRSEAGQAPAGEYPLPRPSAAGDPAAAQSKSCSVTLGTSGLYSPDEPVPAATCSTGATRAGRWHFASGSGSQTSRLFSVDAALLSCGGVLSLALTIVLQIDVRRISSRARTLEATHVGTPLPSSSSGSTRCTLKIRVEWTSAHRRLVILGANGCRSPTTHLLQENRLASTSL